MTGRRYLFFATEKYAFPILRPLQQAIWARDDEVAWFLSGADLVQELLPEEKPLTSVAEVQQHLPLAVFAASNEVPHFFPGIKVQVFHGFNARKRSRGELDSHFALRGFFDLYCTQGPSTTSVFERLAKEHGYFRVVETGWPKMDPLFNSDTASFRHDKPVVMLTSTFSPRLSCAPRLLDTVKQLIAKNSYRWLVQFHPKMPAEVVQAYQSIRADNYEFIDTTDVTPWLRQADVMVCDTSSILQEFLQLNRPVVTLNNRTPGPWLHDIAEPDQLEAAIDYVLTRPAGLMNAIAEYNRDLHPYTDGLSSQRVLQAADDFIESGFAGLKPKPLNLVRKFKIRKRLNYWGVK